MSQFKAVGIVPFFTSDEFYLRVNNGKELESFYKNDRIDTKLRRAEGKPVIGVRGELTTYCKPGNLVELIVETKDRKNGFRGIRGISIKVLK
jgi:hypothetical protein